MPLFMRHLQAGQDPSSIQQLFEDRYKDEPFVDVLPKGQYPATRHVRGVIVARLACGIWLAIIWKWCGGDRQFVKVLRRGGQN